MSYDPLDAQTKSPYGGGESHKYDMLPSLLTTTKSYGGGEGLFTVLGEKAALASVMFDATCSQGGCRTLSDLQDVSSGCASKDVDCLPQEGAQPASEDCASVPVLKDVPQVQLEVGLAADSYDSQISYGGGLSGRLSSTAELNPG